MAAILKLLFALLCLVPFAGTAQFYKSNNLKVFNTSSGLPDEVINCQVVDEDGFLWIGTPNGLSRFDGSEFKNFYSLDSSSFLPGNSINYLASAPGHLLLICTNSGLSLLNTENGKHRKLVIQADPALFAVENIFMTAVFGADNTVWAGTGTSLYQLDANLTIRKTFRGYGKEHLTKGKFSYVVNLFPGNKELLIQHDNGSSWYYSVLRKETTRLARLSNLKTHKLYPLTGSSLLAQDASGNSFFMSFLSDSLRYLDIRTGKIHSRYLGKYVNRQQISYGSRILLANKDLLCISLTGGGLLMIRKPYSIASEGTGLGSIERLPVDFPITSMFCDRDYNLWLGTGNGLYLLYKQAQSHIGSINFPDQQSLTKQTFEIGKVSLSEQLIFVSSSGRGFYYKDRKSAATASWKNNTWEDCGECNDIWNIRKHHADTFWVGTQKGLYWWIRSTNTHGLVKLPKSDAPINESPVTVQFKDSKGLLWIGIGRGNGLVTYDLKSKKLSYFKPGQKPGDFPVRYPMAIAEDEHGNIWMGSNDNAGLVKWDREKKKFSIQRPVQHTVFDNGVISNLLADQRGSLWIGTPAGLLRMKLKDNSYRKFTTKDGLHSNTINTLARDSDGMLWIGTRSGLHVYNPLTSRIIRQEESYASLDQTISSIEFDPQQKLLYYATAKTVHVMDPKQISISGSPLIAKITDIKLEDRSIFAANEGIRIPYNHRGLNISFTAVNLADGFSNEFYYRIRDKEEWIPLGKQRQVTLFALPSGKYIFQVMARVGNRSSAPVSFSFMVDTPFWRTWWFIISGILLVSALVYGIYRYQIGQYLKIQDIRSKIAGDLHDQIGSALTNINILAQLSTLHADEPAKVSGFLKRIGEEAGASSNSLDDIVWSVDVEQDTFGDIAIRMRRYAAELLEPSGMIYKLHLDDSLVGKQLDMELRKDIYLIFKEAIHNIYKHSGASQVKVSLSNGQKDLLMVIEDNGRGFDHAIISNRNGLRSIRSRVEKWGGICSISSEIGAGTTISIKISLPS